MGFVDHDHAQVGDLAIGDPVDQGAVGGIDQLVAPVRLGCVVVAEANVEPRAQAGAVQVAGHEAGDVARGLDTRLGDENLAGAGEDVRIDALGGHHQPVGQEGGFAAAGGAHNDSHLMALHGLDQSADVLVGDAEVDSGFRTAEFALDGHPPVDALRMVEFPEASRLKFAIRLARSGRASCHLGGADVPAFAGVKPPAGLAALRSGQAAPAAGQQRVFRVAERNSAVLA